MFLGNEKNRINLKIVIHRIIVHPAIGGCKKSEDHEQK
jgi:hypothetical protein